MQHAKIPTLLRQLSRVRAERDLAIKQRDAFKEDVEEVLNQAGLHAPDECSTMAALDLIERLVKQRDQLAADLTKLVSLIRVVSNELANSPEFESSQAVNWSVSLLETYLLTGEVKLDGGQR